MDKDDPKKHGNKSTSATGPRTAAGKERSKLNAVKHGIFSKAVVLRTSRGRNLIRCFATYAMIFNRTEPLRRCSWIDLLI